MLRPSRWSNKTTNRGKNRSGICLPPWLDKGSDQLSTFALKSELGYGWLAPSSGYYKADYCQTINMSFIMMGTVRLLSSLLQNKRIHLPPSNSWGHLHRGDHHLGNCNNWCIEILSGYIGHNASKLFPYETLLLYCEMLEYMTRVSYSFQTSPSF
jgi:hypothetical protein